MSAPDSIPAPGRAILARLDGATIAYHRLAGETPGIVFFGGFRSDMTGTKALFLEDYCRRRGQAFVRFDGEGTIAGIRGASLLKGRQHADTTLVADHAAADCTSREVFKSVLDEEARNVFQGKITVRPHAQKTDAKMSTHALLLSDKAEADNKPELEIFADDVQCGHGATSGALDEDLLFYLKARGIPPKEAEALLIQAFVGEAVEGIEHAGLRDALIDHVVAWVATRG